MPKNILEVQDEYSRFKSQFPDTQLDLTAFAKQIDVAQGTPGERAEAYDPKWYDRANATVDRVFRATGIPEVTGEVAGKLSGAYDQYAGTNIRPTVEAIGKDLPRMTVESLLTIPAAATGVGAPAAGAVWLNRLRRLGQVAGYGGTALSGTANTDSYLGGAISAATMGAANKLLLPAERGGIDVGKRVADTIREKMGLNPNIAVETAKDLSTAVPEVVYGGTAGRVLPVVGAAGTEAAVAAGLNEVARQGQLSVGPNAVGLTDPARNPLTPENIAANVVNAVPFAGQAALGVRSASGFDPRAVGKMQKWIETRKEAVDASARQEGPLRPEDLQAETGRTDAGFDATKDTLPLVQEPDLPIQTEPKVKYGQADERKLVTSVRSFLDAARMAETEGDSLRATEFYGEAKRTLDSLGITEASIDNFKVEVKDIVSKSLEMPRSLKALEDLTQQVNQIIDFWNENRVKIEQGEIPPVTVGRTQATHPNARHPLVVEQLQKKGLIPYITEDLLREKWQATFDDTGNPQFASDVIPQKVANYILDQLPDALKKESEGQVATPVSKQVQQIDSQEAEFFRSLAQFSGDVQDRLVRQTIKFRSSSDVYEKGRQLNRYDSWQKAIITAAQTFDPASQTVEVYKNGKLQRTSIVELWDAKFEPVLTPVKTGAGGKGKTTIRGKTVPETNLEAITQRPGETPEGELSVVEQAQQAGLEGDTTQGAIFRGKDAENAPVVEDLPIPAETQKSFDDTFYKQSEQLRGTVEKLSDRQAWLLMKDVMLGKRAESKNVFREKNAKLMLQALLEYHGTKGDEVGAAGKQLLQKHQESGYTNTGKTTREQVRKVLENLFKDYSPLEGVSKTSTTPRGDVVVSNRAETAMGRQRLVLQKLLDPKVVEAAKSYGGPMKMASEPGDFARYQELQKTITEIGDFNDPKLQEAWAESEKIKNRNGGMPPKEEVSNKPVEPQTQRHRILVELEGEGWHVDKEGRLSKIGNSIIWDKNNPNVPNKIKNLVSDYLKVVKDERTANVESFPQDVLINDPKPNDFLPDVQRTLRDRFTKVLGERGRAGTLRDLYVEMGMAIARQATRPDLVDFYRIQKGPRGLAWEVEGRGKVGLSLDNGPDAPFGERWVHDILNTFSHELAHIDDFILQGFIDAPDAFSKERRRQLENLHSLSEVLDPVERDAIITSLEHGLRAPGYRPVGKETETGLAYGSSKPEEFRAVVRSLVDQALLFGKERGVKDAMEVMDYLPTEIQEFAQGQYRTIRDVLQGIKETLTDPELSALPKENNRFVLGQAFHATLAAAEMGSKVRDAAKEISAARESIASMTSPAGANIPQGPTDAMWYKRQADITKYFPDAKLSPKEMSGALEGIREAKDTLGVTYDKTKKPGVWARWFYPFANLMHAMEKQGVDLARPLFNLVNDTEAAIQRRRSDILAPFLSQRADGTFQWDDNHPLIQKASHEPNGPWRDAFNRVSEWQNKNKSQPMFVKDAKGTVVPATEEAAKAWEVIRKRLSSEDQQVVAAASLAADEVGQREAKHTLSVLDESMTIRVANLLMTLDRKKTYDMAYAQADQLTQAFLLGDVLSLDRTGLPPEQMETVAALMGGPGGLVTQFKQVSEMLQSRPGYRTEQLPHDWVIMYRKDGETLFDSAPSEKQAQHVARTIQARGGEVIGEIVQKSDLRSKYQAFDDPDVLLQKFSQVEGKLWDQVVEKAREKYGDGVAEELRQSYTPGAESMKDVMTQGFQKFLKEKKSQIDTSRFDYLDAMLSRAGRLAASASFRTHGMMKDLILNDPRGRMFPSLRNLVNDHWDEMMRPTSDFTKKMKAATTGYFLGANLSSAAIEGTQSIMTLVPTLIATNTKGGIVKAYDQLGRAIAAATEMRSGTGWEKLAQQAESKVKLNPDVQLSNEETRAFMYRKAVSDGIIGHGVIQDLLYSRDQKTLEVAKFGQGDYGPVPKTQLAGNGLYLATQLMMKLYSPVAKFNDKIAFMAGVNQGIELGLTGDDLYNHARKIKSLSTFGGGKANAPGIVAKFGKSDPAIRSAFGVVNTLQQYGYGMVAMYGQLAKDSIDSAKNLTPRERYQARKAFGTMLATQVALGGALGVPFAGAALTLVEKLFGIPANQAVREGLASLSEDDETGAVIAETALNGIGNQMFGLDVSSRLGVSNLLGTSAYRGFDLRDLFGPTPSLIQNMAQSLNYFGQGEPLKAARSLVPNAFKNILGLADSHAKYGDYSIRDSSENLLYTPSEGQRLGYALGFRPRELSQRQQAQRMTLSANEREQKRVDRELDGVARRLLQGDTQAPVKYAQDLFHSDPTIRMNDVLRKVVERAIDATVEKDLLAAGPRGNAEERVRIAKSFGGLPGRQSEVQLNQLRTQLAAQIGVPELVPGDESWQRAAMVDSLVQEQGMARSQALALVSLLGR